MTQELEVTQGTSFRELIMKENAISEKIANGEDLSDEEIQVLLIKQEDTEAAILQKVDHITYVLDGLKSRGDMLAARAEQIRALGKRFDANAERLKNYLKGCMEMGGLKEISGSDERFTLSPTTMRLVITDENALPKQFVKQVIINEPQKDAIKEALENMEEVPGARLEGGFAIRRYAVKPKPAPKPKKEPKAKKGKAETPPEEGTNEPSETGSV